MFISRSQRLCAIKNPLGIEGVFCLRVFVRGRIRSLTMTYFHRRSAYYHWRGSVSPSCSGWEGVVPLCYGRQTKGWGSRFSWTPHSNCLGCRRSCDLQPTALCHAGLRPACRKKVMGCYCIGIHTLHASQNYRIKPHGQLVRVSLTHYCASTPRLSTLWSSTTL